MSNQKQKLAEMVMQKMKQKKQAEQRNRPHYEVLRLDVKFSLQQNDKLKQQISESSSMLKQETQMLDELKQRLQQLQNTGKKTYPVIIIKPQFIASQNVTSNLKEFYRKASNTFLKADMIKAQKYSIYLQKQEEVKDKIQKISQLQRSNYQHQRKNTLILRQKRVKVLKQDLRRRKYIEQQNNIASQIQKMTAENKQLLKQYQIKKQNLQNRIAYSQNLQVKIAEQKRKIQEKYNPVSYRQYLKKVFDVRIKNQLMEKNLISVISSLNEATKISEKYKKQLQKKCSINFIGKVSDSPSKTKGRIQKQLQKNQQIRSNTNPKNLTDIIDIKSCTTRNDRTLSKHRKSLINLDSAQSQRNQSKLMYRKQRSERNHNSAKTLKSTFKSSLKSDRTLSTTLGFSTAKKMAVQLD